MHFCKGRASLKTVTSIVCAAALVSGCASGNVVQLTEAKIEWPRVIALNAPSAPWVIEIQNRLKQKGFKVLRWSSRTRVTEQTSSSRSESFNEAEARYILVIDGYAPYDWANRCFGGGYKFSQISTDLVDTRTNETILNVNGSGYSEGCAPMSGTIFADIANAVDAAWSARN